jgi:hypothetical protein
MSSKPSPEAFAAAGILIAAAMARLAERQSGIAS